MSQFGKVQGRVMINVKFVPAGVKESDFTEEGEGKESLKDAQSRGTRKIEQGPLVKMGELKVEIFEGKGFNAKIRHKLFLRLQGSKNKEMTQTVRNSSNPEFTETIIIPVYKKETQDVPLLVIQDVDPDQEDILSSIEINFSKIAYTQAQSILPMKWYSFIEDPNKAVQLKLTFTNANYQPKNVTPINRDLTEVQEGKVKSPKFVEFKFDDQTMPDPIDTDKFADEFPSEEASEQEIFSEGEQDQDAPPKIREFNINDANMDITHGSGDFENLD